MEAASKPCVIGDKIQYAPIYASSWQPTYCTRRRRLQKSSEASRSKVKSNEVDIDGRIGSRAYEFGSRR